MFDTTTILTYKGNGDIVEPEVRALKLHGKDMNEEFLVKENLTIATELCIYTNHNIKTLALRTRYRRMQLDTDIQDEIMPKNILMIGSTGLGKTEISYHLVKCLILFPKKTTLWK